MLVGAHLGGDLLFLGRLQARQIMLFVSHYNLGLFNHMCVRRLSRLVSPERGLPRQRLSPRLGRAQLAVKVAPGGRVGGLVGAVGLVRSLAHVFTGADGGKQDASILLALFRRLLLLVITAHIVSRLI